MKAEIAKCCKQLRLSRNIADICNEVTAESHQEYLLKILRNELIYREVNRKNRLIKQCKRYNKMVRFRQIKTDIF